ncbi:MAG TPA: SIMPL domain-containing protein [Opitutus sp.]|nr:SIMPL domain-containing protein [Opitutus sp.]
MITNRAFVVLGVTLAAGRALFGVQVGQAVKKGRDFDRFLTVKGLSEREVTATLAIWPIRFTVAAEDLPGLKLAVEQGRATVLAYLASHAITPEDVTFGLPAVSDREEEREMRGETGRGSLPRYKAVVTLVVRSARVDVVKSAIQHADTLLEQGISLANNDYSDRPEFLFADINGIKPEMIQEATANARIAAEKFAQDSQARVGRIRRASQGAMEIYDRDIATPERKILRVVTTVDFFLE